MTRSSASDEASSLAAGSGLCNKMCTIQHTYTQMTTTLSVRIDTHTKKRLEALAKRARRSKSFLAAEAIAAFVETESWQLDELQAGLGELNEGRGVAHEDVSTWLHSWGKKPPAISVR